MNRHSLLQHLPAAEGMLDALSETVTGRGHANPRGLTVYGVIVLQEMMRRGMMIDIDHMSQKASDLALDMAEAHDYPVIASHCWFRDLAFSADVEFDGQNADHYGTDDVHKVAHEGAKPAIRSSVSHAWGNRGAAAEPGGHAGPGRQFCRNWHKRCRIPAPVRARPGPRRTCMR